MVHEREMGFSMRDLKLSGRSEAERAASKLGGEMVDFQLNEATEWAMVFTPFKNLEICFVFQRYGPEIEDEIVTFFGKETVGTEIPIDDLYDFARL